MRADVNQWSSALGFFIQENTPCRDGAATNRMGFPEINFSQFAFSAYLMQIS
ncbi:hypothetical protein D3C76_1453890 [compost metagenome]